MSIGAGNTDAGEHSAKDNDDDDEHNPFIADEFKPRIPRTTQERFATWTESLGFESMNESSIFGLDILSPTEAVADGSGTGSGSGSRSKKRKRTSPWLDMNDFPPLLSTLNMNGRPRFDLIKSRQNGRLEMKMVQGERPQVVAVQTPPMKKQRRLEIRLINSYAFDQLEEEVDDDIDELEEGGSDREDNADDEKGEERFQSGTGAPDQV